MICQIKRDPNTDEILEVLDPFGRTSKVFDQYVEYFSKRIDDPIIAKEEAAKSYILSNSAEGTVEFMSNPPSKRLLPVLKETGNEFLQLENKNLLVNLSNLSHGSIHDLFLFENRVSDLNYNIDVYKYFKKEDEKFIDYLDSIYEQTGDNYVTTYKLDSGEQYVGNYAEGDIITTYEKTDKGWVKVNVILNENQDLNEVNSYVKQNGGNENILIDLNRTQQIIDEYTDALNSIGTYEDQYQITLDYIKKHFLNLGYDVMDVQQLAELYISSFVTQTTEPNLFYYAIAAVTPDEQVQNFIYNNLPLYDDFRKLLSVINDHYELSEVVDPSRYNYVKKEGKMTEYEDRIIRDENGDIVNVLTPYGLPSKIFKRYLTLNNKKDEIERAAIVYIEDNSIDDLINDYSKYNRIPEDTAYDFIKLNNKDMLFNFIFKQHVDDFNKEIKNLGTKDRYLDLLEETKKIKEHEIKILNYLNSSNDDVASVDYGNVITTYVKTRKGWVEIDNNFDRNITLDQATDIVKYESEDKISYLMDSDFNDFNIKRLDNEIYLIKYKIDTYDSNYKSIFDNLHNKVKSQFNSLNLDDDTLQNLIDLFDSAFINNTIEKSLFYYTAASLINDEELQNFIYNNLNVQDFDRFLVLLKNRYSNYYENVKYSPNSNIPVFDLKINNSPEESRIKIDKAKENIRAILGDAVEVSTDIETVMDNMKVSGVPFGLFFNNLIYLNEKAAEQGTEYHEAFHAVFRMFLNDKEIDLYLNEARKEMNLSEEELNNRIDKLRDSVSNYSSLSRQQLEELVYEEYLADKYQDFTKTNKPSTKNLSIVSLFNRLMNAFLKLIGVRSKVEALFYDINNQRFKNKTLTPNRFVRQMKQVPMFQQIVLDNQGVDANGLSAVIYAKEHETDKIISDIAALVYQEIQKKPQEDIYSIFERVMEDRYQFYDPFTDENQEFLNSLPSELYEKKYNELVQISNVFNINDEENKHNINVIIDGLKEKYKLFQFNPFEEDWNVEDEDKADNREMLDVSNVNLGGFDMVNSQLREFMSLLTYETEDEYTGKKIFKSVDGSVVYNGLVKALASIELDNLMGRFEEYVHNGNPMSKVVFDALKKETGYGTDEFDPDHQLINLFRVTFDKETMNYLQLLFDSSTRKMLIINANRQDVDQLQIKDWHSNWSNNAMNETLSKEDLRKTFQEQYESLVEKIIIKSKNEIDKSNSEIDYYERINKVIDEILKGFVISKKDPNDSNRRLTFHISGLEELTGITLSRGFILYSILDNYKNNPDTKDYFESKIPLKDQRFYKSFKELLINENQAEEKYRGLDADSLKKIGEIMFRTDDDINTLYGIYQSEAKKLISENKDPNRYNIPKSEFRNIYIPFPQTELPGAQKGDKPKDNDALGFIKKIALANSLFDETIVETSFQDANQNQRYSYVMKAYQTVTTRRLRSQEYRRESQNKYPEVLKDNYLLSGNNTITNTIFDRDFKFSHTGDVRQTAVRLRDANGKIIDGPKSNVQEGKGVTSKTIDFKSLNILQLSLFAERRTKTFVHPDIGQNVSMEYAYYIPKIFETKSTDEAVLLPVNSIHDGSTFFDSKGQGLKDNAVEVLFKMFDSELGLIDKTEKELTEGLDILKRFLNDQNNAETRLKLQLELAKLRNKEYNTEGLSEDDALLVLQEQANDLARKAQIEKDLDVSYNGPLLYEGFHLHTDGKGSIAFKKDDKGNLIPKGVGRGFDLWNFKGLTKYSPRLKEYLKARKDLANFMLYDRPLNTEEDTRKKKAGEIIRKFNAEKNSGSLKAELENAIRQLFNDELAKYHNRLTNYKILLKDNDGKIVMDASLVPMPADNKYSDVEDFLGNFFINDFINSMSYNLLVDKDPRIRKDAVDAVKRNAGSLAFGGNLGRGEFTVAYRDEQEKEYEIVNGQKKEINRDDGQAHMTTDRFIFVLKRLGKLGDSIKPIVDKLRFGEEITWEEKNTLDKLNCTFNSVKGVYFDGEFYHKLSYAILLREWTSWLPKKNEARAEELKAQIRELEASVAFRKGVPEVLQKVKYLWDEYETLWVARDGNKVLHNMRVNMQLNGIDEVLPKSASKLITPIVSVDKNGYHNFLYNTSKRKNEFWRLQVETPSGKTKVTFPSQLLQIIDNEQIKSVTAALRGEVYEMDEVIKKYRKALADRVRNSVENAISVLGTFDEKGKFQRDMVNFQKKIKEVLLASGSDEVLLDFFRDFSVDGKSSKYNFNIPAIAEKFEQQFLAHFSKNVLQQIVPGRKVSLISDYGNEVVVDENDNVITRLSIDENPEKYYEEDVTTGEWKLKPQYKTRRLTWSEKGELKGIRFGKNLITKDKFDPELFNNLISLIETEDSDDVNYDLTMQNVIASVPELLREYLNIRSSLLISKTTGKPIKNPNKINIEKVISGLQTGIDTLALAEAKEKGIKTGGTTTVDYGDERGSEGKQDHKKLASLYGVKAISKELYDKYRSENKTESEGSIYYKSRTEQNVLDADVTIYFHEKGDEAGLKATEAFAKKHKKPFFVYGVDFKDEIELGRLLSKIPHATLNVAGNRDSKMSQEFKDEVQNLLHYLFSPFIELDENDPDVTVDYAKLKQMTQSVRQASLSEVIMPAWSKEIFNLKANDIIDYKTLEEFKSISERLTEEDYARYKTNKKAIDSILQMFGTRIPTEDKRSMIAFKIVDFLPIAMGDVAVLPLETILFSGEDFDIDSKYVLRKDFYTTVDDNGKTMFNVYGEYSADDLRRIYNPDQDPNLTDEEIEKMHLFEEYIKYVSKYNTNVKFDMDEAKLRFINEQHNGVDVFAQNDKEIKSFIEEMEGLQEQLKPITTLLKEYEKTHRNIYKEYTDAKSDLEPFKEYLKEDISEKINDVTDEDYKQELSEANNIYGKFTKDERRELAELLSWEYEIQGSPEYQEYKDNLLPNNKKFNEYLEVLKSLSNTQRINDTTRQGLETYVDKLEREGKLKGKKLKKAQDALAKIAKVKADVAELKKETPKVQQLERINTKINDILSRHIIQTTDENGNTFKLSNSNSHQDLKKRIYKEAKTTIKTFFESIRNGESYQTARSKSTAKNNKWRELKNAEYQIQKLQQDELKPLREQIENLQEEIDNRKDLISQYNLESLLIAMKMNKLPSSYEEFLKHPHYKRLNNSAINNEIVDMVTLLYLNKGMDEIRYATTTLHSFHGDVDNDPTDIGLSKIMLTLTGRNIDDFLYNTAEGKMQAKEANKLGAQLIGPVAVTNIVKAILSRSQVNMRTSSVKFDDKSFNDLGIYETEDIEYDVQINSEGNYEVTLKVNQEGKPVGVKKRVMSEISLLLSAMTDNAKHGDAFKLNLTLNSLGVYTYMLSLGIGTNRTMLFANQPALYEYNMLNSSKDSAIMSNEDINKSQNLNEIKQVKDKYSNKAENQSGILEELEAIIKQAISVNPLADTINYHGKNISFTEFSNVQNNVIQEKDISDLNISSKDMMHAVDTFRNLKLDYLNMTKEQIVNAAKKFENLDQVKELYKAVATQVHVIRAFGKLQKQSKVFSAISALSSLNKGLPPSFYELQKLWDMIDTFKINTNDLIADNYSYTNLPDGSDVIYDIRQVLEQNEDLKQMLIHFLKIHEISKEFVISQTDYFDRVFNKIVENLRLGIKDRGPTLKQIKKDLLSFLSLTAYKNSFIKRGQDVPFGPEFLYTHLVDSKEPNSMRSKTLSQQLEELLEENPTLASNIFIKTITSETNKIAKDDINLLAKNPYALPIKLDLITADSRKKVDAELRRRIVNGFRELMSSTNPKVRQFADNLFYYTIVKDGMQFKNQSFIKYIPAEMYLDYSDILEKINYGLRNNIWESTPEVEGIEDIVGMTKKEIEDTFINLFVRDPENRDLLKRTTNNRMHNAITQVREILGDYDFNFITTDEEDGVFYTNTISRNSLLVDVSSLIDYKKATDAILSDPNNGLPLLNFLNEKSMLHMTKDLLNLYKNFEYQDININALFNIANFDEFKRKIKIEQGKLIEKKKAYSREELSQVVKPVINNTPFNEVLDKDGLTVGLEFPLFFVMENVPSKQSNENEGPIEYDANGLPIDSNKEQKSTFETYILASYDPILDREYSEETGLEGLEERSKFKYKGTKAKYIKVTDINTSIYNYLYTPQEYKHLMMRLVATQNLIFDEYGKQTEAIKEIEDFFKDSKDTFTYSLEMDQNPQVTGGSIIQVLKEFRRREQPNTFTKTEEKFLSRKMFGESKHKLVNDPTLAVNLLSDKDKEHLSKDNLLLKTVTNKDILNKLKLNINETALVKINNNVYKVTNKGLITPYDMVSSLGLNKKNNLKLELSPFISEYSSDMNAWLGYDEKLKEYLPFSGTPSQVFQIEPYYENTGARLLPNEERPNYGITEVVTVFGVDESNLTIPGITIIDEVNVVAFDNKLISMHKRENPQTVIILNNNDTYSKLAINYLINGNITVQAAPVSDPQKGVFVIDVNDLNASVNEIKEYFINNNIPFAGNKIMIVKSQDDKSNYKDFIKSLITNDSRKAVGLSKNLSDYTFTSGIVSDLRKLGYYVTVDSVMKDGLFDIMPNLLTQNEEGKNLYNKILNYADEIRAEMNEYNRKHAVLSDDAKEKLKNVKLTKNIKHRLAHDMKHSGTKSKMRDDLVNQGITDTYEAIKNYLRTQTSRQLDHIKGIEVDDIIMITSIGRPPLYARVTGISKKTVGQLLLESGITKLDTNTLLKELSKSEYAKQWSQKQGWDISYMAYNIDSIKDKYDVDFEYIPDLDEFAKENNVDIVQSKFGWKIDDPNGFDRRKALNSNSFIGYVDNTSRESRVATYIINASNAGIPFNDNLIPDNNTVAFVAVPIGTMMTQNVMNKILNKASEVLEAGGSLIMNTETVATNEYNKYGEGVIIRKLHERYNNLKVVNDVNYKIATYSLENLEKDLQDSGQEDLNCK